MERTGINGTKGHLNFRGMSGFCILRIIIERAKKMNAESVPILTSSIIVFNGKKPAINDSHD